jgi:hypothetical protein
MVDHDQPRRQLNDAEWELQVAQIPPLLRPKDFRTIPSWMLYHYGSFPKRFDTHFFFARMPEAQEAAHDRLETSDGVWVTPEDALARFGRGDFPLVFATIHQLNSLIGHADVAAAQRALAATPVRTIMPRVIQRDGDDVIVLPDAE